ncbi:uncharacterized protein LOC118430377 [Branchiostoma floridae]|uniref:Uncharacterized protein LOC118430377 n=1 Tax=Branchiostoma floridae TaxID=7739 RepID=A0A9J7M9H9_BRAFL|nr:uncharacterized protein LOC118430377 [Branchiostoma floridae]
MRTIGRDGHFSPAISADVLQQHAWNYVGGTYDSNTGMESIWNNGEMVGQKQIGVSTVASQYPIRVAVRDGDNRRFRGRISCLQIYNYAMTQEQIVAARRRCFQQVPGGSGGTTAENTDSPGAQLSGGAIAGIVIGVLVGVGLLAVFVHHCKKTGSQPTPANRANPNPQAARVNNTVVHSPTVVSQNPAYNPYPPPPQYPPPPAYNTAVNMPTQPPGSQYTSQFHSSLDPAYAPPPEPVKYGMT